MFHLISTKMRSTQHRCRRCVRLFCAGGEQRQLPTYVVPLSQSSPHQAHGSPSHHCRGHRGRETALQRRLAEGICMPFHGGVASRRTGFKDVEHRWVIDMVVAYVCMRLQATKRPGRSNTTCYAKTPRPHALTFRTSGSGRGGASHAAFGRSMPSSTVGKPMAAYPIYSPEERLLRLMYVDVSFHTSPQMPSGPVTMRCTRDRRQHRNRLDGAGRHHLLPQVVLVLADAALPPPHRLLLAHHDFLCDLVKQPAQSCCQPP